MKFTQFLRPNGRQKSVEIEVIPSVQELADELVAAGWKFEIEVLSTGHVHADCCNEEGQLASFIEPNGPGMAVAVASLVSEAHTLWCRAGKAPAAEFQFPEEPEQ